MEHRARKRFGQHFLHDPGVIARIVDSIAPQPCDRIVEIGPGLGALTRPLLERAGRLCAVEIDRDILPHLKARCAGAGELEIIQADALTVDFRALGDNLRVTGNLPYNISTPLLFHLLAQADAIRDMHFMLQREVVERMAAVPGERAYGRLSVTLAARARVERLFTVGRGAFRPPPQVESAVARVVPRAPDYPIDDMALFDRVVARAFGQRRKTLLNALKGLARRADLEAVGLDPGERAERVAASDFARLANHLRQR